MYKAILCGFLFIFISICSFGQESKTKTYTFKKIGWTVDVPADWEIVSNDDFDKMQERGMDSIQNHSEKDIKDMMLPEPVINLITVKKSQTCSFSSNIQKFNTKKYSFSRSMHLSDSVIVATYRAMGEKWEVDTTTEIQTINHLNFKVLHINVKLPQGIALHQDMYARVIKGYMFIAFTTYIDDENKKQLTNILKNSRFNTEKKIGDFINVYDDVE